MIASKGKIIRRVVALVIPVGVFLSLAACKIDDGPTGLEITQDQWIDAGGECTVPELATPTERIKGVLDVAVLDSYSTHYLFYPLLNNLLGPLSGQVGGDLSNVEEKNNILLKSFKVKLEVETSAGTSFAWDPECSGEFDVPTATAKLPPQGSLAMATEIIRPCNAAPLFRLLQAAALEGVPYPTVTVNTTIRAHGSVGSTGISSPPFRFPVDVCYGCLQTGYSDPAAAQVQFPAIPKCSDLTTNPYKGDSCNPAQDYLVLCCATSVDDNGNATGVECPGVPTSSAGH
jgi:hypothetical protein